MQHATAGEIAQNGSTIHNTRMYFVLLKKSATYKFGIDTTFLSSKPHPRLFLHYMQYMEPRRHIEIVEELNHLQFTTQKPNGLCIQVCKFMKP